MGYVKPKLGVIGGSEETRKQLAGVARLVPWQGDLGDLDAILAIDPGEEHAHHLKEVLASNRVLMIQHPTAELLQKIGAPDIESAEFVGLRHDPDAGFRLFGVPDPAQLQSTSEVGPQKAALAERPNLCDCIRQADGFLTAPAESGNMDVSGNLTDNLLPPANEGTLSHYLQQDPEPYTVEWNNPYPKAMWGWRKGRMQRGIGGTVYLDKLITYDVEDKQNSDYTPHFVVVLILRANLGPGNYPTPSSTRRGFFQYQNVLSATLSTTSGPAPVVLEYSPKGGSSSDPLAISGPSSVDLALASMPMPAELTDGPGTLNFAPSYSVDHYGIPGWYYWAASAGSTATVTYTAGSPYQEKYITADPLDWSKFINNNGIIVPSPHGSSGKYDFMLMAAWQVDYDAQKIDLDIKTHQHVQMTFWGHGTDMGFPTNVHRIDYQGWRVRHMPTSIFPQQHVLNK